MFFVLDRLGMDPANGGRGTADGLPAASQGKETR